MKQQFDIYLSDNFRLSEFVISEISIKQKLEKQFLIPLGIVANLQRLCTEILQPARDIIQIPILVNSGYRCDALNKLVGGSSFSQHLHGNAADITCMFNFDLFNIIKDNCPYDQLICYGKPDQPRFLHVSLSENPRHQILYRP